MFDEDPTKKEAAKEKTFLSEHKRSQIIDWRSSQKLNGVTKYAIGEQHDFYTYEMFLKEKEQSDEKYVDLQKQEEEKKDKNEELSEFSCGDESELEVSDNFNQRDAERVYRESR